MFNSVLLKSVLFYLFSSLGMNRNPRIRHVPRTHLSCPCTTFRSFLILLLSSRRIHTFLLSPKLTWLPYLNGQIIKLNWLVSCRRYLCFLLSINLCSEFFILLTDSDLRVLDSSCVINSTLSLLRLGLLFGK